MKALCAILLALGVLLSSAAARHLAQDPLDPTTAIVGGVATPQGRMPYFVFLFGGVNTVVSLARRLYQACCQTQCVRNACCFFPPFSHKHTRSQQHTLDTHSPTHLAQVETFPTDKCGGVLVRSDLVLTSAGCLCRVFGICSDVNPGDSPPGLFALPNIYNIDTPGDGGAWLSGLIRVKEVGAPSDQSVCVHICIAIHKRPCDSTLAACTTTSMFVRDITHPLHLHTYTKHVWVHTHNTTCM